MIGAAIALIAGIAVLLWLSRVPAPCGCPYIERVTNRWPAPPPSPADREESWRRKYNIVPEELKVAPGGYFD